MGVNREVVVAANFANKNANFDVSVYPVKALVETDGVQYATVVENQTAVYADLFSIDMDTYFPRLRGKLAWVYVNISYILWAGTDDPLVTWKLEAQNKDGTWTIMSAEETLQISTENNEGAAHAGSLEGYLLITTDLIDQIPFSIRLQFKSDSTAANDKASMRLKNDTVIRAVGSVGGIG